MNLCMRLAALGATDFRDWHFITHTGCVLITGNFVCRALIFNFGVDVRDMYGYFCRGIVYRKKQMALFVRESGGEK